MISLIAIPALLYHFGSIALRTRNANVVEACWFNQKYWDSLTVRYPDGYDPIPARSVRHIYLSGDPKNDEPEMRVGERMIAGIMAQKDTTHAVFFHFGAQCKYSALIQVIDLALAWQVLEYVVSDNGVFMFYEAPRQDSGLPVPEPIHI